MPTGWSWARAVPAIGVASLIFILSHQPGDTLDLPSFPGIDKAGHAVIYGLLSLACHFAVGDLPRRIGWRERLSVILFCALYGVSDEWHQSFVPFREPSLADLVADAGGALAASLGLGWWWGWRRRRGGGLP